MGFIVRRLKQKDLNNGFFETLANLIPVGDLSPERASEIYREISSNPVYNIFVAVSDTDEIVGTITILIEQKFLAQGLRMGRIEDVSTRKGFEGQGIGKALVEAAVEEARNRGCFMVDVSCADDNVSFYEECGFKEFKENEHAMKIRFI